MVKILNSVTCSLSLLVAGIITCMVSGTNCDENENECASGPCMNGGECVDGDNKYTCTCPDDFMGTNCELVSLSASKS